LAANSNVSISRKKILSLIGLIVFSLAFIFSLMKSVLPIGKFIVCTFGHLTYPLLILLMLIELAKFLGFSYTRNVKSTVYWLVILFSILAVIQSISTYKELDKVVGLSSLGEYLKYSYNTKVTLLGGAGSIVVGLCSILLGAMGTIILFVIMLTIFIGVLVDYNNYGKFEQENIKKLKNKAIRKKVAESDANALSDGAPAYSFNQMSSSGVAGEIEVNENELNSFEFNSAAQEFNYSPEDVAGEITENYNYEQTSNYESQQQYEFSSDFYKPEPFPNVYSEEEMAEYRKRFMSDTFGAPTVQAVEPVEQPQENLVVPNLTSPVEDYSSAYERYQSGMEISEEPEAEPVQTQSPFEFNLGSDGDVEIDDEISKLLNAREEEVSSEPETFEFNQTLNLEPEKPAVVETPRKVENVPYEGSRAVTNNIPGQNQGIMTDITKLKPVVQSTPKPASSGNFNFNTAMPGVRYNPPPLSLLKTPVPDTGNYEEEQNRKAAQLEESLKAFNIEAKVVNIVRGPKITRYELSVPLGVPVKRIPSFELDIQRSLAARTITIKAPIPGSPYVGIELENDTFTSVYERELLESTEFQNAKDPLPIAIGKDISGEIVVKSLAKMVHLLIAGSTGSGKSVFIHNLIMSLIYKYSPDNLRLVLIDPKKVEFNIYNGLPHLITPEVVMGAEKAINALKWCVKEMDRRYDMMSKAGYNNIEPYNKSDLVKAGQFEHLPYIVIVVDELAEIMCANKKDSELCIQRITQLARACGMHLVLATQRPSVDIISGVIKNNVPSRIAFSLQSGIDSKTILNTVGAEKLLGQGDMIFAPTGTSVMSRLQAAYASDSEIAAVIDYDKKYNSANYDESVENSFNAEDTSPDTVGGGDGETVFIDAPSKDKVDEYFKTAIKIVMMQGSASISYLQRRLSIGYSRAAKIIDQMEDRGYIAPATGAKQRKVLITPEQFKDVFGEDFNTLL